MAKARLTKAQKEAAKQREAIQNRAQEIMEEAGIGFVKALIRARREAGLVPEFIRKQQEAAAEAPESA